MSLSQFIRAIAIQTFALITINQVAAQQLQPAKETARTTAQQQPQPDGTGIDPGYQIPQPVEPQWSSTMSDEERDYLTKLLDYWQSSSQQIRQCTCDFTKWCYDGSQCSVRIPQTNELAAFKVLRGTIKYASPDKALLDTVESWSFVLNPQTQQPDLERATDDSLNEKWVCDGKYVYEYDFRDKKLIVTEIPEPYRGEGLVNSPLPFLFGADRQTMLDRYWIHVITPANATGDAYWLEAVPKRIQDTRNYSRVIVVIARSDFLPKSMIVYSPNYNPQDNQLRSEAYAFENRRINAPLDQVKDFLGLFVPPRLPAGWTRQEQKVYADDTITAQRDQMNERH